jgi:hypothetical protein
LAYQPVTGTKASGCPAPSGNAPGVSDKQIKLAVAITNIQGPVTNKSLGLPSPEDQQAACQAVIASLNGAGGVACRQLVPQYVQINPADPSDLQSKCLDISHGGVFALLDGGGTAGAAGAGALCYAHAHVPFFGGLNLLTAASVNASYPYLFDIDATTDNIDHNAVFALKSLNFFSPANGFKRLGVMVSSCTPEIPAEMSRWLNQAGVPASQTDTYNFGCPAGGVFPPSSYQQAVLKFKQAGDTHVIAGGMAGWPLGFTRTAAQQSYKPKYGLPDENIDAVTTYGSADSPDVNNLADAILISTARYGEENTPGVTPDPATVKCNAIVEAAGLPSTYKQGLGGQACDEVWMFAAAADHAQTLSRDALAAGLQAAKSIDFSYPMGKNDFSGSHVTIAGGQYWRTAQFMSSCKCWQLIDRAFHPAFPSDTNLS